MSSNVAVKWMVVVEVPVNADGLYDPFDVTCQGDTGERRGVLTCEHAVSSYGMPVAVDEDGRAYGPGDVRDGHLYLVDQNDEDEALVEAARAAGYRIAHREVHML